MDSLSALVAYIEHDYYQTCRNRTFIDIPAIVVSVLGTALFLALWWVFLQLPALRLPRSRPAAMSAIERAAQDLNIIDFNRDNFCDQAQSTLFSVLPGEIRDRIFAFALAEFEDKSVTYDSNTCYRRPEYGAPRRSDTALLRTCQRVYEEAFFYPFALAEQILWLTSASRRPRTVTTIQRLKPSLALMHKLHGDTEMQSVRVFAQLYALEGGSQLSEILNLPHFSPRTMTVTIRHTGKHA